MTIIEYAPKLSILGEKEKRLKIIVGGRGSTKSTFVADWVLAGMTRGQLWCCGREYQNTIEESVHRLMLDEVGRLEIAGFTSDKGHIYHESGGRNFYRGLGRNPSGMKSSLTGVHGLWIEEGETLSEDTLRQLSASLRLSASDVQRKIKGEKISIPEIWITMNRGSSQDPVAKKWLNRAESQLEKTGIYEDDFMLIVQINFDEIPKKWFVASGLEQERQDDFKNMSRAAYDHKWHGAYNDHVERAIIEREWFDAAIDAHEKLGFKPTGAIIASHDPSDLGNDPKGYAIRHGSVILDCQEFDGMDVNDGCDWALDLAMQGNADWFIWDADGMGVSLKRQIDQALRGKKIQYETYFGSHAVDNPRDVYLQIDGEDLQKAKSNEYTFYNKRSQYHWYMRDRFYKTYLAVEKGEYHNPDELISLSSKIKNLTKLRAEACRVPRRPNGAGKIQIMSKDEMRRLLKIDSPNMFDALVMTGITPEPVQKWQPRAKLKRCRA